MRSPVSTYRRALALHKAATTEGEQKAAARLIAALIASYGAELQESPPEVQWEFHYRDQQDKDLIVHVLIFMGLRPERSCYRRSDGKGLRYRDTILVDGPPLLLAEAKITIENRRAQFRKALEMFSAGWLEGAMPLPLVGYVTPIQPLTEEEIAVGRAGLAAGTIHNQAKRIE
jgi:hypothetical protein